MEGNNFNNDFDPEKDARLTRKIQLILLTITMIYLHLLLHGYLRVNR